MAAHIRNLVLAILKAHEPIKPSSVKQYLYNIYRVEIGDGAVQALLARMRNEGVIGRAKGAKYCTLKYLDAHPENAGKRNFNITAAEEVPWERMVWFIRDLQQRMVRIEDAVFDKRMQREQTCTQMVENGTIKLNEEDDDPFS